MASEVKEKQKRTLHGDRVLLTPDALIRLDAWTAQVKSHRRGIVMCRKDLLNWLILRHPPELSREEAGELTSQFFSEVRFLQQALGDIREAKARGETVHLKDIISTASELPKSIKVRVKKVKKDDTTSDDEEQNLTCQDQIGES